MNVRDLIEGYNAAWNAQDLDAIHAFHHPDIVFENHTADERAEGAEAVREHIAGSSATTRPCASRRARCRQATTSPCANGPPRPARKNGTGSTSSRSGTG
jgi:ketosteroid isomerase-like protein